MSVRRGWRLKQVGIGMLAGVLVVASPIAVPSVGAVPEVATVRIDGATLVGADRLDRYATAADLARRTFLPQGVEDVVVARGDDFPDALAGSALAGSMGGALLLVQPDAIPAVTAAALQVLDPTRVHILGGTDAVRPVVEEALDAAYDVVTRVAGENRYETAAEAARAVGDAIGSFGGVTTAFLTTGLNFADAVAAGSPAYSMALPILLTRPGALPAETAQAITDLGVEQVIILGGTDAVNQGVEDAVVGLPGDEVTDRIPGANRQETAVGLATRLLDAEGELYDGVDVSLARGDVFADALVGSQHAGSAGAPVLLALSPTALDGDVRTNAMLLSSTYDTVTRLFAYGGTAALSDEVLDEARDAAQTPAEAPMELLDVAPMEPVTLTAVANPEDPSAEGDDRRYTVSGLTSAQYGVTLFDEDNVTVGAGEVSFVEDGDTGLAAAGDVAAAITLVNGVAAAPASSIGDIPPTDGTITFTVDGHDFETIIPVVYEQGGADARLEIDDNGFPTEGFGLGGTISYVPEQAATGTLEAGVGIDFVDRSEDIIVANDLHYNYDENDFFFLRSDSPENRVDLAAFEAELSAGDELASGTVYQQDPNFESTFILNDLSPMAPGLEAEPSEGAVLLTITTSAGSEGDEFVIVRSSAAAPGDPLSCPPAGDPAYSSPAQVATLTVADDGDAGAGGIQYSDVVADAACYEYSVTAVRNGEESATTDAATATPTTIDATTPLVLTAYPHDDVDDGVGSTSRLRVIFTEDVTAVEGRGFAVGSGGVVVNGGSAEPSGSDGDVWVVTLEGSLNDAPSNVTYVVSVAAGAFTDEAGLENDGNDNAASFPY